MVDSKIQDLIDSAEKDAQMFRLSGAPSRSRSLFSGRLSRDVLSAAELTAGAKANLINKDFLNKLTFKKKDVPDVLKGKYNPDKEFKLAFTSMGQSIESSINSIIDELILQVPKIEVYGPKSPVANFRSRMSDSVAAFDEIITTTESANLNTNSSYATFKNQLNNIRTSLEPIIGMPSNITKEVDAMYKAAIQFENVASQDDFLKMFTLPQRNRIDGEQIKRPPGDLTKSPIHLLKDLRTATDADKRNYRVFNNNLLLLTDLYVLLLDTLDKYQEMGFNIISTVPPGRLRRLPLIRRWTPGTNTVNNFPNLPRVRDEIVNKVINCLNSGNHNGGPVPGVLTKAASDISLIALPGSEYANAADRAEQRDYMKKIADIMKLTYAGYN